MQEKRLVNLIHKKLGEYVSVGSLWRARRHIYGGPVNNPIRVDDWVIVFSLKPSRNQGRFTSTTNYYWDVEVLGSMGIAKFNVCASATWLSYFWASEELLSALDETNG